MNSDRLTQEGMTPMQNRTYQMRPRRLRRLLALTGFGAILAGAAIGGATEARADAAVDYAAQNAAAICLTLDEFPTFAGIMGIGQAIVEEGYLSFYEAGRAIGVSVAVVCPHHQGLIDRFAASQAPTSPVVKR